MQFDDGSAAFEAAIQGLLAAREALGLEEFAVLEPGTFLEKAKEDELTIDERIDILEQAAFVLEHLYCHLPFKRARYAIDPLQQLRLLRREVVDIDALEFHARLLGIFARLRDAHTNYFLPAPFASAAAFLPFTVRYFHDSSGRRRFEVGDTMAGFQHPHFTTQAELLRWNGLSMEAAIDQSADLASGANASARFLRSLNRLTVRPLLAALPPPEDYVVVEYLSAADLRSPGVESRAIRLPWRIVSSFGAFREQSGSFGSFAMGPALSRQAILRLFYYNTPEGAHCYEPNAMGPVPALTGDYGAPTVPEELVPRWPEKLVFQFTKGADRPFAVPTQHLKLEEAPERSFGYLRILDFALPGKEDRRQSFDRFRSEFRRILSLANERAPDGLIVDIRSNPGGDIVLAESLLQYLTPSAIEPARFAVLQTNFIQNLASRNARGEVGLSRNREWAPWAEDLTQAPFTGSPLTRGFPLSDRRTMNAGGQIYQGPVLLLLDGLTYSAADFFAAGFEDNEVGTILGVQESSGGGGANRWTHADLLANLAGQPGVPLKALPKGARLGVSIRRSLRAGLNSGQPLEDVGVVAKTVHRLTAEDLHNFNFDLLQRACRILASRPGFHLSVVRLERNAATPSLLEFEVASRGLLRVEASLSSPRMTFPQRAFRVQGDGRHRFALEMDALPPVVTSLDLRGYTGAARGGLRLCAETKVPLTAGPAERVAALVGGSDLDDAGAGDGARKGDAAG